jgi:iron-sulfur cluster assembly accessory protein
MITISETAKDQIYQIIESNAEKKEISSDELFLRVYVAGGGCGGIQYGMAITTEKREDDISITNDKINILIDKMSSNYLDGAEVDFIAHELGARFKINAPEHLQQNNSGCGGGCSC